MKHTDTRKIDYKTFELKVDDVDSKGLIRGYASTFGNVDYGYDVVDKGAFKASIQASNGGKWPILADHNPSKHIGYNMRAEEDDNGLYVEGKLNLEVQEAKERHALMKQSIEAGTPMGLSIGYYVIKAEDDFDNPRIRRLKELKLFEYSVTVMPMNTQATISQVKKADVEFLLEQAEKMGITKEQIRETLQVTAVSSSEEKAENNPFSDEQLLEQKIDILLNELKELKNANS